MYFRTNNHGYLVVVFVGEFAFEEDSCWTLEFFKVNSSHLSLLGQSLVQDILILYL